MFHVRGILQLDTARLAKPRQFSNLLAENVTRISTFGFLVVAAEISLTPCMMPVPNESGDLFDAPNPGAFREQLLRFIRFIDQRLLSKRRLSQGKGMRTLKFSDWSDLRKSMPAMQPASSLQLMPTGISATNILG